MVKVWVLLASLCVSDGDKGVRCGEEWVGTYRSRVECLTTGRTSTVVGARRWRCVQRSSPT